VYSTIQQVPSRSQEVSTPPRSSWGKVRRRVIGLGVGVVIVALVALAFPIPPFWHGVVTAALLPVGLGIVIEELQHARESLETHRNMHAMWLQLVENEARRRAEQGPALEAAFALGESALTGATNADTNRSRMLDVTSEYESLLKGGSDRILINAIGTRRGRSAAAACQLGSRLGSLWAKGWIPHLYPSLGLGENDQQELLGLLREVWASEALVSGVGEFWQTWVVGRPGPTRAFMYFMVLRNYLMNCVFRDGPVEQCTLRHGFLTEPTRWTDAETIEAFAISLSAFWGMASWRRPSQPLTEVPTPTQLT
jgi:hypothetical protein